MSKGFADLADKVIFSCLTRLDFCALFATQRWCLSDGVVAQYQLTAATYSDLQLSPRSDGAFTPPFPPPPLLSLDEYNRRRVPPPPAALWIRLNGVRVQVFSDGDQLWWWHPGSDAAGLFSPGELDFAQRACGSTDTADPIAGNSPLQYEV
jgi:hypothetical protein